jgi:hypothetical protein
MMISEFCSYELYRDIKILHPLRELKTHHLKRFHHENPQYKNQHHYAHVSELADGND